MSNIETEVGSISPQALIRYMLYTDVNRRRATQVGSDAWVDLTTILGNKYDYGTKHEIMFSEIDDEPNQYIVAMIPYIRQVPHPEKEDELIPLRFVYLASAALWPFFDPIAGESLNMAMLPE
ncbi:hypothetical protein [Spirosoma flavum]|uniref:Uncharacterized protein n=1 Tax=Spirosoma flavum TaxID=2048557 RepID=A0ABW6ADK3_9BACT